MKKERILTKAEREASWTYLNSGKKVVLYNDELEILLNTCDTLESEVVRLRDALEAIYKMFDSEVKPVTEKDVSQCAVFRAGYFAGVEMHIIAMKALNPEGSK